MTETIEWNNLGFGFIPTDYNVRCTYADGKWGELRTHSDMQINLNIAAAVLHYAQESFEGLKAFRGKDGKVRIFRVDENAKRMQDSCKGIEMPILPVDTFREAVLQAVKLNERFIPPYGSSASLYIRPVLFATTPLVGVKPAVDYEFIVFVSPVGPYFKGGFQATPFMLSRKYDRAAPLGTGMLKVGGNYAAGMKATVTAHDNGYSSMFYLDPKEKKYIDECGAANFFAIKGNTYVTPQSSSILPSITNRSLSELAESLGMTVERRPIAIDELSEFDEAGACGTAAVISPIARIDDVDNNKSYIFSPDGSPGRVCTLLYNKLRAIQRGEEPDTFGWTMEVTL
ncbi:MAG: branched-chain amino acid aminotransferase [Prevotellaceae bacterium]|jgi:branched-chain amino acid aminotransferase|nr:branched-chain amino acid aminotransferase [Prevotellaceae bacterium]